MVKDDAAALREARKQVWPGVDTLFWLTVIAREQQRSLCPSEAPFLFYTPVCLLEA